MEIFHAQIAHAIRAVRSEVRWRPGSAARHLLKRKLRGHLPVDATLGDYERVILAVLGDPHAQVYIYQHHVTPYVAVVAVIEHFHWLVMFSLDGLIESAYVVEHPDHYLSKSTFDLVGPLSEVIV
jgi:hypothetical protein